MLKKLLLYLLLCFWVSESNGQTCNLDQTCWKNVHGRCTITGATPFERRTPITCEECANLCLSRLNGPAPFCCESVVYDCAKQTCDIFAVKAGQQYRLQSCPDTTYFEPTRNPQCCSSNGQNGATTMGTVITSTPTTTTPMPISDCPTGQTPVTFIFKDSQSSLLNGGTTFPAASQAECLQFCQKNQDNSGKPVQCKAAQFTSGQCTITSNAPAGNTITNLQPSQGGYYYEKKCVPSGPDASACKTILMDPKHMLVGYNTKPVDSSSFSECLTACLNAQANFGFKCASAAYYSDVSSMNCILNIESAQTKPDAYTSTQDSVTYMEPQCSTIFRAQDSISSNVIVEQPSAPSPPGFSGKWTLWSECNANQNFQVRFLNCPRLRITLCPNETRSC